MHIYINNKLAALKQGTSFEYVSENRLFSGSDGYTLNISFPLRGCPENIAIFGHLYRADVTPAKLVFDCEIRARGFHRFGSVVVTEINEAEVKTQFLEGRSEQNFTKTLDKIYINELKLGAPTKTLSQYITPTEAWGDTGTADAVALPWVLDASGNVQNKAEYKDGAFKWHTDTKSLSWQPYLLTITKAICAAIGYAADFSAWEAREDLRYLLVCNSLPSAWCLSGYAAALPHWCVEEFFAKLELFLDCEFDIDHRAKSVKFGFTQDRLADIRPVALDAVVEEHSTEVAVEEAKCEYREAKNLVYKDCDHDTWKYYCCDWFTKNAIGVKKFESLGEVLSAYKRYQSWDGTNGRGDTLDDVIYAADVDAYFLIEPYKRTSYKDTFGTTRYNYSCRLRPINLFGGRIVDTSEDAPKTEIEFVPVRIDETDSARNEWTMFLNPSGYDGPTSGRTDSTKSEDEFDLPNPLRWLKAGEKQKAAEFYDRIYIGWWDGALSADHRLPHPYAEDIEIPADWSTPRLLHFSLRLNDRNVNRLRKVYKVAPEKKTTFKFLASSVPDVRALFLINGKRFICEKITATFTEQGMSQLLKGVFYPVAD